MSIGERKMCFLRSTLLDYRQTEDFLKEPLILERAEGLEN